MLAAYRPQAQPRNESQVDQQPKSRTVLAQAAAVDALPHSGTDPRLNCRTDLDEPQKNQAARIECRARPRSAADLQNPAVLESQSTIDSKSSNFDPCSALPPRNVLV